MKFISLEQKQSSGSWSHRVSELVGSGDGGAVMEQELLDRELWDHWGCAGVSLAGTQQERGGALGPAGEQGWQHAGMCCISILI